MKGLTNKNCFDLRSFVSFFNLVQTLALVEPQNVEGSSFITHFYNFVLPSSVPSAANPTQCVECQLLFLHQWAEWKSGIVDVYSRQNLKDALFSHTHHCFGLFWFFLFVFLDFFFPKSWQKINVVLNLRLGRVDLVITGKKSTRLQNKSSSKNRMRRRQKNGKISCHPSLGDMYP